MLTPSLLIKVAYVLVAIVVLLPSLVTGVMTLYAIRATYRIAREAPHDPGDTVYAFTNRLTFTPGKTEVDIYPRVWAAVLIITGFIAWLVGVVVLLFVRHV